MTFGIITENRMRTIELVQEISPQCESVMKRALEYCLELKTALPVHRIKGDGKIKAT
jgi:hypothetical protein